MVRGETGRLQFGSKEQVMMVSALLGIFSTLIGGAAAWFDVKEKHAVAMTKFETTMENVRDHEVRIRTLENDRRGGRGVAVHGAPATQGTN